VLEYSTEISKVILKFQVAVKIVETVLYFVQYTVNI
jgi:hypothetical protein